MLLQEQKIKSQVHHLFFCQCSMRSSYVRFINCLSSSALKFAVPNAALLAFNASVIVNHDQDQHQGIVPQNDAVLNA
jgi:hypothetical protein